jgi:hypothetical protein
VYDILLDNNGFNQGYALAVKNLSSPHAVEIWSGFVVLYDGVSEIHIIDTNSNATVVPLAAHDNNILRIRSVRRYGLVAEITTGLQDYMGSTLYGGKRTLIDAQGNTVLAYDDIRIVDNGLFIVGIGEWVILGEGTENYIFELIGKYGVVDIHGNIVIPFDYDAIHYSMDTFEVGIGEMVWNGERESWEFVGEWNEITVSGTSFNNQPEQTTPAQTALATDGITVVYNGNPINFIHPQIERNGFIFHSLEEILIAITGGQGWNGETSTVYGEFNGNKVEIPLNNLSYWVNGVKLDTAPELAPFVEGIGVYVYIGYIIEGLGLSEEWDGATRTLTVK